MRKSLISTVAIKYTFWWYEMTDLNWLCHIYSPNKLEWTTRYYLFLYISHGRFTWNAWLILMILRAFRSSIYHFNFSSIIRTLPKRVFIAHQFGFYYWYCKKDIVEDFDNRLDWTYCKQLIVNVEKINSNHILKVEADEVWT